MLQPGVPRRQILEILGRRQPLALFTVDPAVFVQES